MRPHHTLFDKIRQRTGMYLQEETYAAVAAFVLGYDLACEGGALSGFREWLITELEMGSNLAWTSLVLHAAFPNAEQPQEAVHENQAAQRHAIDTLFDLIAKFDQERDKNDGLNMIFKRYQIWLTRRR